MEEEVDCEAGLANNIIARQTKNVSADLTLHEGRNVWKIPQNTKFVLAGPLSAFFIADMRCDSPLFDKRFG